MYERVMRLWKQGKTSKEIEAILELPESDVLGYVRNGPWYKPRGKEVSGSYKSIPGELKVCNRGRKTNFSHERFLELWNMRVPINKMAEILGTTPGSVKVYATRHRDECPKRNRSRVK